MKIVKRQAAAWRRILPRLALASLSVIHVAATAQSVNLNSHLQQQLHQAVILAERGNRQRAMVLTLEILQKNPKFAPALKLKGTLLEDAGRNSEAEASYEDALKLEPNDPDLLLKVGISRLTSGQTDEASALLRRCLKIVPNDADAQYYLAQAYHLKGQDDLALAAVKGSLKADPQNPSVWQKYGELLCSTGDCEGGLPWLIKAQKADATLPRIDFDVAATDFKLADYSGAAQFAARASAAQPGDLSSWQLLATANVKLAQWSEARSAFAKVLALKPNDVETQLGLGQCDLELKNYPAAVEHLQATLRLDPTRLLAHFYLSRAFAGLGQTEDSQREAALHQLMMQQATFVPNAAIEQREGAIKPKVQELLAAHHEEDALQLYRQHFKGTSTTLADAYVFAGKTYLFMGKTDDGLRCLHHALKLQPNVHGAHVYEGILALKLNDVGRAEKEFQAELAIDPNSQMAMAEMGEVRYHQSRWSEAAEQLANSHTMTPELLYLLCDSYFHLGKISDANLTAEAATAYARNKPAVTQAILDLLVRNGQSDLAKRLSAQ